MKTLTSLVLAVASIGMVTQFTACQTTSTTPTSAVTCEKCKIVWVKSPHQVGPAGKMSSYIALRSEKSMDCPDCESAVATFFKTGSLKHTCSHCGGALTHCEGH